MAKPRKVEETAAPYTGRKSARNAASDPKKAEAKARYLDNTAGEKLTDKIFAERKNLLRKLAQ